MAPEGVPPLVERAGDDLRATAYSTDVPHGAFELRPTPRRPRRYPDDVDDPEVWRWVWLTLAVGALVAEMASAGTFFALPFAIGAAIASVLAFVDAPLAVQWLAFFGASVAGVAALRPLAKRLDVLSPSEGIGAKRYLGQTATVLAEIPAGVNECGMVRVGREEWRAESRDGTPVPAGALVKVIDVTGTRLVVWPLDERKEIES